MVHGSLVVCNCFSVQIGQFEAGMAILREALEVCEQQWGVCKAVLRRLVQ